MLKTVLARFNSTNSRSLFRVTRNVCSFEQHKRNGYNRTSGRPANALLYASFLAFFKKTDEEDDSSFLDNILPEELGLLVKLVHKKIPVEEDTTEEGKLKTTLKRTILCIHRREYDKAEQMAHLALRMAQDIQNYDGITLCFDIMANLAFDREQYEKAQKLFEEVLKRLILKGTPQDDIRVLHLSLKVAQLVELQGKIDEAKVNYAWTISKLDGMRKIDPKDADLLELWGLTNNFYGKFLLKHGKFAEALQRLQISREIFVDLHGRNDPEYVNIMNNLAVAALHMKDFDSADKFIDEAIRLSSVYTEMIESGIYHANKALICLQRGLLSEAQRFCNHADKASLRSGDPDGREQAKYCLEQIQNAMKNNK